MCLSWDWSIRNSSQELEKNVLKYLQNDYSIESAWAESVLNTLVEWTLGIIDRRTIVRSMKSIASRVMLWFIYARQHIQAKQLLLHHHHPLGIQSQELCLCKERLHTWLHSGLYYILSPSLFSFRVCSRSCSRQSRVVSLECCEALRLEFLCSIILSWQPVFREGDPYVHPVFLEKERRECNFQERTSFLACIPILWTTASQSFK